MPESLRDLVVSLSLNTENFTRNINSVNKQIREAESSFKLAAAGIEGFDNTAEGLSAKLTMLQQKMKLQKDVVGQYERALAQATSKLTECATRQADYAGRLDAARQKQASLAQQVQTATAQYEKYKATLGENNLTTMVAKANMEALEKQYKEATQDVEKLAGQEDALQKASQNAADAVSTQQTQLNKAKAAVKETAAAIEQANKNLKTVQSAWTAAGKSIEEFSKRCTTASKAMVSMGRSLSMYVTTPVTALATSAVKASLDFESTFASVRKTVDATEEEFAQLEDASKEMSTQVAASTSTINEVMATGGQLGIANEHLREFTKVMIDLGNSCEDLSADEAATSIAKFANVMGTDQSLFQNIGSTIVELGNNFATTEKPIAEMAMRLAGAGKQVGLTESQVLGFAAALSSVGIQAQMGGSSLSKALIKMEVACAEGGEELTDFANICGMTEEQFKTMFESDPAAVFQKFITSLAQMDEEGISAIAVLNDIGISEIRLRDTLLRSVNANELFAKSLSMADNAWKENSALTIEANKRYATTESQLTNLKNKAVLFAQTLGDDLNPTIKKVMSGISDFIDKLMEMDSAQRMQLIRAAGITAAIGPGLLIVGKLTKGIGALGTSIGKFATAVGKAGGGISGFFSVLSKSPAVWMAIGAATITASVALVDYVSGAKQAREALEGMQEAADKWKQTAAETFYGASEGLGFFGMSSEDFAKQKSVQEWMDGLLAVWTDGQLETDEIVSEWTESFKTLTDSTRQELQKMKEDAQAGGYTSVVDQLSADLSTLDSIDAEISALLQKRQNGYFSEEDKIRLQDLIDTKEAIEIKYKLTQENETEGFDEIRQKLQAEVARAQAMGQEDAGTAVYQNAVVAAAEGMASINSQIDAEYDKEYALIQMIEDSTERQAAMEQLNAQYAADRRAAAQEYAQLLSEVAPKVWNDEGVQQAATDIGSLNEKLREYSLLSASDTEGRNAILADMEAIAQAMDEGSVAEYVGMLSQIQSLIDSGLSEGEIQAMFPEIDFTKALGQIAAIQEFLNNRELDLPGLTEMFGDALPEEVLKIAADLDMTGVEERWGQFRENPGAITTDAVIEGYSESETVKAMQPKVEAFVDKYTEVPEGADKAELTPTGVLALVNSFAKDTGGYDVSGLTVDNVTAIVAAYEELASGADITMLTPHDITAYVSNYLTEHGVDTTGLNLDGITATVVAYQEATGGALTTSLTPDDITAMITSYAEAEGIDMTQLTEPQVDAIVTSFAEAYNCDKSALAESVTAYIAEYDDSGAKKPKVEMTVGVYGYDAMAYQKFIENNPIEMNGIVRLSEVYQDPSMVLSDENAVFYQDGVEVPVTAVPQNQIDGSTLAVTEADGTVHVLLSPEITGTEEAVAAISPLVDEVDKLGTTAFGAAAGILPETTIDLVKSGTERINSYLGTLDLSPLERLWAFLCGETTSQGTLNWSMQSDFNSETVAELSAYVGEIVAAIQQGSQVSETDVQNLQYILTFLQGLDTTDTGTHILEGVAEGMTEAGWDSSAETVASNLETALNAALGISSPSERVKPVGDYVAAGIGVGMSEHDWSADAEAMATGIETALTETFTSERLAPVADTVMGGLSAAMSAYTGGGAEGGAGTGTGGIGDSIASSIAAGITAHDWTTDAAAMSSSIQTAIQGSLNAETMAPLAASVMGGLSTAMSAYTAEGTGGIGNNIATNIASGITTHDWSADAAMMSASIQAAVQGAMTPDALVSIATATMDGLANTMVNYNMSAAGAGVGNNAKLAIQANLNSGALYSVGVNAMYGLIAGINAGRSGVVAAMRSAAYGAVQAAKAALQISSPSKVFKEEVGVMAMKGLGQGIEEEAKAQAKVIRNAARYLTGEAVSGAIAGGNDNSRTYNNNVNSTVQVQQMVVRDDQDIHALAVEIAALTKRSQRGRGLRG